jgi:hypothetical protein
MFQIDKLHNSIYVFKEWLTDSRALDRETEMFPVQAPELELDSMEERMLTSYLLFLLPPAPSPTARTTGHNGHSLSLSLSLSNLFFIRYFLYLHFKCYPLSWFPLRKPPTSSPLPLLTNSLTPASWSWHFPTLGHRAFPGPRAFPPIDDLLGHPLLHLQLEPWVPPYVFFDWWFSPRDLWGYWSVHIVVPPMGLQTPSTPWVLSLAPSLGILWFDQGMTVSIHFCICQALAEPLRRQLYQAPVSKHLLASTILSGFGDCIWDGSPGGGHCLFWLMTTSLPGRTVLTFHKLIDCWKIADRFVCILRTNSTGSEIQMSHMSKGKN